MTTKAQVVILEVTKRTGYELVTVAGGDRPAYVGTREWRERQQQSGKPDNASPDNNRT